MFLIFNKDKIVSYLVSISTVAMLFVMSFAITKKNNEIIKTSTNEAMENETIQNIVNTAETNYNNT